MGSALPAALGAPTILVNELLQIVMFEDELSTMYPLVTVTSLSCVTCICVLMIQTFVASAMVRALCIIVALIILALQGCVMKIPSLPLNITVVLMTVASV